MFEQFTDFLKNSRSIKIFLCARVKLIKLEEMQIPMETTILVVFEFRH